MRFSSSLIIIAATLFSTSCSWIQIACAPAKQLADPVENEFVARVAADSAACGLDEKILGEIYIRDASSLYDTPRDPAEVEKSYQATLLEIKKLPRSTTCTDLEFQTISDRYHDVLDQFCSENETQCALATRGVKDLRISRLAPKR